MRSADVVIGAGFGDEGKGVLTDALAAGPGSGALVVRFNGGAQAGHTVTTPDGWRHVFSHVGSGSLSGAATFLSRFFVSNPMLFGREWARLGLLGVRPLVLADRDGLLTTPFDVAINQLAEAARGAGRHGSVGIGFGETIERALDPAFATRRADLDDPAGLRRRLRAIRDRYVPARLSLGGRLADALALAGSEEVADRWLADAAAFRAAIRPVGGGALADWRGRVVFEGAQGLLLDQDHGWFPHVTRSSTGLRNVLALAGEAGVTTLRTTYVTRAYVTRHGAGPLPHELPGRPFPGVLDDTNLPHLYQGTLRFAWLDLGLLTRTVADDLRHAAGWPGIRVLPRLAMTCLDQTGPRARWIEGGSVAEGSPEAEAAAAAARLGPDLPIRSYGPSRDRIDWPAGRAAAA